MFDIRIFPNVFDRLVWTFCLGTIQSTYFISSVIDVKHSNFKSNASRRYNYSCKKITNLYHTVYGTDSCDFPVCPSHLVWIFLDVVAFTMYVLVVFWNVLNLIDTDQRRENSRGQKLIKDNFNANNWSLYFKSIYINVWHINM